MHSIMLTKIFTVLDNAAALRNSEIKSNFKKEGYRLDFRLGTFLFFLTQG